MADNFDYSRAPRDSRFYEVMRPVGRLVNRALYDVRYTGQENIPAEGGFILACNHFLAVDPLIVAMGVREHQIHFMAKKELYDNWIINKLFTMVGAFPVMRGGSDRKSLEYAVRILNEGRVFGIFPEGTRSKTGAPGSPKSGVALIAKEAHADILPVSVFSSDDLKKHTPYTVRYGKVIKYEQLGLTEDAGKPELKAAAQLVMDHIVQLWEAGHCE